MPRFSLFPNPSLMGGQILTPAGQRNSPNLSSDAGELKLQWNEHETQKMLMFISPLTLWQKWTTDGTRSGKGKREISKVSTSVQNKSKCEWAQGLHKNRYINNSLLSSVAFNCLPINGKVRFHGKVYSSLKGINHLYLLAWYRLILRNVQMVPKSECVWFGILEGQNVGFEFRLEKTVHIYAVKNIFGGFYLNIRKRKWCLCWCHWLTSQDWPDLTSILTCNVDSLWIELKDIWRQSVQPQVAT